MPTQDTRLQAEALTAFVKTILVGLGVAGDNAAAAAEVIVEADLRGVDSHGINGFASRVKDMQAGKIDARAVPTPTGSFGALAAYDGHQGYGPVLIPIVLEKVVELAGTHGIGMVVLRDSSHWGCPAYYSRWMAKRGFLGIAVTNTNPAMPLWGSSARTVGNNPMTIAAPRRADEPIVLDMAMQQISWGGLAMARREGRTLPGPWGYDADGAETNDPGAIIDSGRVRPAGDYKGSGLAFMLEILTGVMAAGSICYEIGRQTKQGEPAHYCQSFIAMKPDAFAGEDGYSDAVEALYAEAKASPLAAGFDEISLPGDRSNAILAERRANGIPLQRIHKSIEALSAATGVPGPAALAPVTPT